MMKVYPSWFMFFLVTIMGVLFVLSGDNWFMVWVGFELTLLGFIPLFLTGSLSVESMIKYFLVQAGGSALFIVSFFFLVGDLGSLFIFMSMLLKMGMFPFYYWVPSVMSSFSWVSCLILVTVQKLSPLIVLSKMNSSFLYLIIGMSVISVVVGGVLGVNQMDMRPLMAYSSISHSGWMVSISSLNLYLLFLYIVFYFLIVSILFFELHLLEVYKVVSSSQGTKSLLKIVLLVLIMMGIPPFSMFFLKMMVLQVLFNYSFLVFIMLGGTYMSVYFYIILTIPNLLKVLLTSLYAKEFKGLGLLLFFNLSLSPIVLVFV